MVYDDSLIFIILSAKSSDWYLVIYIIHIPYTGIWITDLQLVSLQSKSVVTFCQCYQGSCYHVSQFAVTLCNLPNHLTEGNLYANACSTSSSGQFLWGRK